jgi:hypothetical protein
MDETDMLRDDARRLLSEAREWLESTPPADAGEVERQRQKKFDAIDAAEGDHDEQGRIDREHSDFEVASREALEEAFEKRFRYRLQDIFQRFDALGIRPPDQGPGPSAKWLAESYRHIDRQEALHDDLSAMIEALPS